MFPRKRLTFVLFTCLSVGLASAFTLFWYLNAPVYDFLAKNRFGYKAGEVVLVESNSALTVSQEARILSKLNEFGANRVIQIRDQAFYVESELDHTTPKDSSSGNPLIGVPVSADLSRLQINQLTRQMPNALLLLEPQDDYDGIVRMFDAQRYSDVGLRCSECLLSQYYRYSPERIDEDRFVVNYLDHKARLPRVSSDQLLNDWLPGDMFKDKLIVLDLTTTSIKDIYRTNLFSSQKVSFAYYVASVVNTVITDQRDNLLPTYGVFLLLFTIGLLLSLFVRDVSLRSALILTGVSIFLLVALNTLTLALFNTFVPVFEYATLCGLYLLYAVKARNQLVLNDLKASVGQLELALAETNIYADQQDTELCSGLHRFFSRAAPVNGLAVYELVKSGATQCVLMLNQSDQDALAEKKVVQAIEALSSHPERLDITDSQNRMQSYFLMPVMNANQLIAGVAIMLDRAPEQEFKKLIALGDKYHDELNSEIKAWLSNKNAATGNVKIMPSTLSGRRRVLAHRNRNYLNELMERYKQAKNNYNRLDSAVSIYDIYGNLKSTNSAADAFAQTNSIVWYDAPLNFVLTQITDLTADQAQNMINHVLMNQLAHRFTLGGAMKDCIGVLSQRGVTTGKQDMDEPLSSFLCLEIINISNIGTSARLKDSYVRDLTNQIKQDLSKLTLLVDKFSIVEEDSEKYRYLSEVISKLSARVRESREFLVDLPSIESSTSYSVSLLEMLDQALARFEKELSEKNIKLIYNKPSFVNQTVLEYRSLEFVFDYLFELLLDDSLVNSSMEVMIQETASAQGNRLISIVVKNNGYGLPKEMLDAEVESSKDHPLNRCEEFAKSHGGSFNLSTIAGEGIEFNLVLPVTNLVH